MKLFFLLFLLSFLGACSKKSGTRTLEITHASLSSEDFQGGVIVRMTNLTTKVETILELTKPPFQVLIEDGKWSFDLVGFPGPNPWEGSEKCGSTTVNLASSDLNIDLGMNKPCALVVYQSLITPKKTKWDSAQWDNAKWAP